MGSMIPINGSVVVRQETGIAEVDADFLGPCSIRLFMEVVKQWDVGDDYSKWVDVFPKKSLTRMERYVVPKKVVHSVFEELVRGLPNIHDNMRHLPGTPSIMYSPEALEEVFGSFLTIIAKRGFNKKYY